MGANLCPRDEDLFPPTAGHSTSGEVRSHLQDCARCRERVEQLRRQRQEALGTSADASTNEPPPTLAWVPPPPAAIPVLPERSEPPAVGPAPLAIGKYRILCSLDKGGQAFVYLALHPTLHKEVVVKWSRRPMGRDEEDRSGLLREGRLLADLNTPGLARVYDLDFHEDRPFLVMEYIRGRNLRQYVEQQRPSPRQAALLLARLAQALETAHARGIIHQDIKPQNVVIDEAGLPHLIDFGLAKLRHAWAEETNSTSLTGTPAFMSPEQARREHARIGSRADVFALGGLLYYLLTGKLPFSGETVSEVLDRAARGDWDRAALRTSGAPRQLARLCEHALATDPDDRPASARQMAQQLEAFVQRPRRLMQAGTLVLVLILGALAWWLLPWTSSAAVGGEPSLEVQVWRGAQSFRLLDALPLHSGDQVQVLGQVPSGLKPALFWFDSEGQLHELPLQTTSVGGHTAFRYPVHGQATELTGPAGTEVLLVAARRAGPVAVEEVRPWFAERPWPLLPPHALLVLDGRQARMLGSRAPGRLTERAGSGIVEQAESLRAQSAAHLDVVLVVAFPHRP